MPRRKIPLIKDNYYHIFNRTIPGRKLFYSNNNYVFYLKLWQDVDFSTCCNLAAYCLMPNHYHYLLKITDPELFPRKLSYLFDKYLKTLNKFRNETGHFFSDRFKAKWIDDEQYLLSLCCYIHLNPIKANLVNSLDKWPYSNYLEFMGKRKGILWDKQFFKDFIETPSTYQEFMQSIYSEDNLEKYLFPEDD